MKQYIRRVLRGMKGHPCNKLMLVMVALSAMVGYQEMGLSGATIRVAIILVFLGYDYLSIAYYSNRNNA